MSPTKSTQKDEAKRYARGAIDDYPERRLLNTLAQRRAGWLENRIEDLFLILYRLETCHVMEQKMALLNFL